MPTKALHFSDVEKKAILSTAYEVVLADGSIHPTEVAAIKKLIASMDLTNSLAKEAQEMSIDEALVPLNNMDYDKKKVLAKILDDIAMADEVLHENEMELIIDTFKNIGIGSETE